MDVMDTIVVSERMQFKQTITRELIQQVIDLERLCNAKQAMIDSLMLEFCPGDMTAAQVENWKKHQVPFDQPNNIEIKVSK